MISGSFPDNNFVYYLNCFGFFLFFDEFSIWKLATVVHQLDEKTTGRRQLFLDPTLHSSRRERVKYKYNSTERKKTNELILDDNKQDNVLGLYLALQRKATAEQRSPPFRKSIICVLYQEKDHSIKIARYKTQ
jgi:hypothetical protein